MELWRPLPAAAPPSGPPAPRWPHAVEAAIWASCCPIALTLIAWYSSAELFPAMDRTIAGLQLGAGVAMIASGWALIRCWRGGWWGWIVARVVVGVPLLGFWLLVAAAGFAA